MTQFVTRKIEMSINGGNSYDLSVGFVGSSDVVHRRIFNAFSDFKILFLNFFFFERFFLPNFSCFPFQFFLISTVFCVSI
jgi:hypothetical protein